jgi:hypothetical protein
MATPAQVAANRANGRRGTGPKTPAGKARSARNALRHGFRSGLPVIPGEDTDAWEAHRAGIVGALAPAGPLEEELAGRVALALWRLRRAAAFEADVTAAGFALAEAEARGQGAKGTNDPYTSGRADPRPADPALLARAEEELAAAHLDLKGHEALAALLEQLPQLPEDAPIGGAAARKFFEALGDALDGEGPDPDGDRFLAALGVPTEEDGDPYESWDGWTAGRLRAGLSRFAQAGRRPPENLLALARREHQEALADACEEVRRLGAQVKDLRRRVQAQTDLGRGLRLLLDRENLERLLRYEAHAGRQLATALHTLERLQAARAGAAVMPPAVLDVTVSGPAVPALSAPGAAGG